MAAMLLVTCILISLALSEARRELPGAIERWELPKGATYKNVQPLIGIMTQECLHCPGVVYVNP